jgi:hypothetical protein
MKGICTCNTYTIIKLIVVDQQALHATIYSKAGSREDYLAQQNSENTMDSCYSIITIIFFLLFLSSRWISSHL